MNPIFKTNLRKLAEEKPPANRRLARYQIEINARPGDGLFMRGDDYNKTFPRLVNAIPLDFDEKIENDMIKFMYVSTGSAHMYVSKYITQFDAKKLYRGLIHSVSTKASSIKGFGNSKDFLCTVFLAKVDAINGKAVSRRTVLLKNLISGADVGCNDKIRNSVDNIEDFRDAENDAVIEVDEEIEEGLETITEEPLPDEQASIYTDRKEMDLQFNVAIEDLQNECATLQSTEYMCVLNVYGVAGPRWPGGGWRLSPSYYTNHFPRFLNEPGLENIKWRYLNEGSHTFVSTATSGREGEECYEQFLRALENKEIQRQLFGESNDWEITTVFSSRSMTTVAQTNKDGTRKALIRKSIMVKMENFEGVFRDGSIILA